MELTGVKYTQGDETLDLYEYFSTQYDPNATKPMCATDFGGCGKLTCYVIFKDEYKMKKKFHWIGYTGLRIFKKDDNIYVPVLQCDDCGAKIDGYRCGKDFPEYKNRELERIEKSDNTLDQKERLKKIFTNAYAAARHKAIEAAGEIKPKSRYQMGVKN